MFALVSWIQWSRKLTTFGPCRIARGTIFSALKTGTVALCLLVGMPLLPPCNALAHAAEIIKIGGTGTGLGTMKLLGEAFEKIHPEAKVQIIQDLGGAGGVMALLQGRLDIAISGSALNRDERVNGISAVEYARTPFVFVVHKKVGMSGLSMQELESVYAGTMQSWPDGNRIRLILRPETDTDSVIISAISPGMSQALKSARNRKGRIIALTDRESVEIVANTAGAIGTSTLTQIATEKLPLKVLAFDGAVPNLTSVSSGRYRLFKPLYLVTTSRITPVARQFADFVHSPQGGRILTQSGNLDIVSSAAK